jgi:chromosomal replication initiation ATPase DnaA
VLEQNAKEIDEARCHRGEREADFLELVSSVGKCLGLSTAELTSGARKQEIVEGRYVVSHIAIRRYGLTPTQVGNALNVSIQSVLRGLERGGRILAEKNLDIGELLKLRK